MPLLDIAIAQSSFPNYLGHPRVQLFANAKMQRFSLRYVERRTSLRKSFHYPGNSKFCVGHCMKLHPKFLIKAIATLEQKCSLESEDGDKKNDVLSSTVAKLSSSVDIDSSNEDLEDVDDREKLRRIRISKANTGKTPWNKGRKHSPETLQLIRERTRLAMQNPKVRMKLNTEGHAPSEETKEKIAAGLRISWRRRRERLKLQATCLFDWQNLIADAARNGFLEEEGLQWNSYEILNEQLKQEWLDSIEYRKTMCRRSRRAPKSLEQRRRIAEAIVAKWADPEYRSKVCSGMAQYHGTPEAAERRVRKKPNHEGEIANTTRKKFNKPKRLATANTTKKKTNKPERFAIPESKIRPRQPTLKNRTAAKFKDPSASTKLEMLKSIRAQRAASESKNEALQRAQLLIEKAEKAAKALEVAAMRSPLAQASLLETRKLIAEAVQSIETIKNRQLKSQADASPGNQNFVEENAEALTDCLNQDQERVNGVASPQSEGGYHQDFNLYKSMMLDDMDMDYQLPTNLIGYELPKLDLKGVTEKAGLEKVKYHPHPIPNGAVRLNGICSPDRATLQNHQEQMPVTAEAVTKKWVRGRLVEVAEGQ